MSWFHFKKLLSASCLLLIFSSCQQEKPNITTLTVPQNYRGIFRIIIDPTMDELQKKQGKYAFTLPKNGILYLKNDYPFKGYHRLEVQYADGTQVPVAYTPNMFPPNTIAVFGPYLITNDSGQKEMLFVITTQKEILKYSPVKPKI